MVSLYVHVPFCTKKCPYCHFYVIPDRAEHKELLYESLKLEWRRIRERLQEETIVSIYFGGGTPSLFGAERIGNLLDCFREDARLSPDCEITLEANPETLSQEMCMAYKRRGINRLSIGVQSLVDSSLIALGRTHDSIAAIRAIETAHKAEIENLSIDLMLELPNQTLEELEATLAFLPTLPITHLSLYNLTIEPHTPFYKSRDSLNLPTDDQGKEMLDMAVSAIESVGLFRYEISAFAKPGFVSQHNTGYWTGRTFYGLGPSAFSYVEGKRSRNVANLNRYAHALTKGSSPVDFLEELPYPHSVCELLAVRLRLFEGAPLAQYPLDSATKKTLSRLEEEGYLTISAETAFLTERGRLFYDAVAAELMPDE